MFALLFFCSILLPEIPREGDPLVLHVSLSGRDAWSGRLASPGRDLDDGPLASLKGARNAIRALRETGVEGPFEVRIQGGVYFLDEPFVLEPRDSGKEGSPVVYEAAEGARPVFAGGRAIRGWHKGEGPLWVAEIPGVKGGSLYFHQLFIDGRRATRARSPNEGYHRTASPLPGFEDPRAHRGNPEACIGFRYRDGDLQDFDGLEDQNLFLYHSWTSSLHWIAGLNPEKREVRFTNRCGWPVGYWEREGQRYHVENFMEALDQPGEWYLDRAAGLLYYWPLEGETITEALVVAPHLRELVTIRGDTNGGDPVEHVTLRGLAFHYTDWDIPKTEMADGQAATFLFGAVRLEGARHCTIEGCEVAHVASYGVWFDRGSQDNRLIRSEIHDLGGGGVRIGRGNSPARPEDACDRNTVDNCFIYHGGRIFPAGCGVLIQRASHNRVTHNEIADFFYTGISIGWSWGYAESTAHHNVAEYNHVHHLGQGVLSDMGGIYTLGVSPGTRINHNIFHHIESYSYGGWGLYTDEGSTGVEMAWNLVYKTRTGGFHQHYGKDNRILNNILAFSTTHQVQRTREEAHNSFFFERNIIFFDNGNLFGGNWKNDRYTMDHNLYFDTSGKALDWNGANLESWKARGHDQHSVVGDPLFMDPEAYDFRLKPGSPARTLGFEDLDTEAVGLYGDPAWVKRTGR